MKRIFSIVAPFVGIITVCLLGLFLYGKINTSNQAFAQNDPITNFPAENTSNDVEEREAIEKTIRHFYKMVNKGKCIEAINLRDDYAKDRCSKIKTVKVNLIKVEDVFVGYAVVYLDAKVINKDESSSIFKGYLLLSGENVNWKIKGYYKNKNTFGAFSLNSPPYDEYLKYLAKNNITLIRKSPSVSPTSMEFDRFGKAETTLTFGSQAILESCWSPTKLKGFSEDRIVLRPFDAPNRADPPFRLFPSSKAVLKIVPKNLQRSIRRFTLPENRKYIALTFDLCERQNERTGYDRDIINYLRKHGIKATFYAGGKWMRSHPDKTKQLIADPLFEIGNHAWTHGNFGVIDQNTMKQQILWTQAQYELLWEELEKSPCVANAGMGAMGKIPRAPLTFRFPYGTCKPNEAFKLLAKYGLPAIQWDVVSGDPSSKQKAAPMAKGILRLTKPGSIIICHANGRGRHTREALPLFIPQLREKGFVFVTVSELIHYGQAETHDTCFELRPGDNERYNRIFGEGME